MNLEPFVKGACLFMGCIVLRRCRVVKCKADLGGRSCANTPYLACCRVDDIGVPRLLTEGGTIIELGLDVFGCSFLLK